MSAVRTTSRLAFATLGVALLMVVAAPAASGQDDPYGVTTTTSPDEAREVEATCSLSVDEGRPGDRVTATVNGVFLGETVRIFFDSIEVGSAVAPDVAAAGAGSPVLFGGTALPAQAAVTSVQITFTVPPAAPGTHVVTAVGDTFTCFCNPDGAFRVLAAKAVAGKGTLPRTGVYLLLFLVAALALLVAGRGLVAASRRRRAGATAEDPFVDDDLTPQRDPKLTGRR
jgi:hypothetical protein